MNINETIAEKLNFIFNKQELDFKFHLEQNTLKIFIETNKLLDIPHLSQAIYEQLQSLELSQLEVVKIYKKKTYTKRTYTDKIIFMTEFKIDSIDEESSESEDFSSTQPMDEKTRQEVIKQILNYHKKHQIQIENKATTKYTLEALSEVTGLQFEDIKQLAEKAKQNYKNKIKKQKTSVKLIIRASIVMLLLLFFQTRNPYQDIQARAFITNKVIREKGGVFAADKVLKKVEGEEQFYSYVTLIFDSIKNKYDTEFKIFDASGQLVHVCNLYDVKPSEPNYNFWCPYTYKEGLDQPGLWKFEFYLENRKLAESTFHVYPNKIN